MAASCKDNSLAVTVVIPAYNVADYIERCLDSVLRQTYAPREVIVVDDGSQDGTADLVARYGPPIRCLSQKSAGASVARNAGVEAAVTEWIAFLDSDDEWLPEHLECHRRLVERYPDLEWTAGNAYRCYCDKGQRAMEYPREKAIRQWGEFPRFESYFQAYLASAKGNTDTMVVRRDLLMRAGLFRTDLPRYNDVDMWFRMAYLAGAVGYVVEPTAIYHLGVPGSIVKTHKDLEVITRFIDSHLAMARHYGRLAEFSPCAERMVGFMISWLLQEGRGRDVRQLLGRYHDLFGPYMRVTTWLASLLPRTAARYEQCKNRLRKKTI